MRLGQGAVGKSLDGKDEQLKCNTKHNQGPVQQVQKPETKATVQHFKLSKGQILR